MLLAATDSAYGSQGAAMANCQNGPKEGSTSLSDEASIVVFNKPRLYAASSFWTVLSRGGWLLEGSYSDL
jgi:hypothetical protein